MTTKKTTSIDTKPPTTSSTASSSITESTAAVSPASNTHDFTSQVSPASPLIPTTFTNGAKASESYASSIRSAYFTSAYVTSSASTNITDLRTSVPVLTNITTSVPDITNQPDSESISKTTTDYTYTTSNRQMATVKTKPTATTTTYNPATNTSMINESITVPQFSSADIATTTLSVIETTSSSGDSPPTHPTYTDVDRFPETNISNAFNTKFTTIKKVSDTPTKNYPSTSTDHSSPTSSPTVDSLITTQDMHNQIEESYNNIQTTTETIEKQRESKLLTVKFYLKYLIN